MTRRAQPLPLGDRPAREAARLLGLDEGAFCSLLPRLHSRGFPLPDPDTGLFDLDAITEWRRSRHPGLYRNALASDRASGDLPAVRPRLEAIRG